MTHAIHIVYRTPSGQADGLTYCNRQFLPTANVYERTPDDGISCEECIIAEVRFKLTGNAIEWFRRLVILPDRVRPEP